MLKLTRNPFGLICDVAYPNKPKRRNIMNANGILIRFTLFGEYEFTLNLVKFNTHKTTQE